GCQTCHVGKLLGGQSFEEMGRTADYFAQRGKKVTADDAGRYNVTKKARDKHRFKVPTLRNVALTFPYFHDGFATTLDAAVKIMAKVQSDLDLTEAEVKSMVAFLGSLNGVYQGKQL
ncbi:MAG: c-type cytochrome, partial [Deltaproteobacteria bacterium]|nr:c-type cytochrome [Deltaproteobacteria bacterium]